MSEVKTVPSVPPIATDEKARADYRDMLIRAGYEPDEARRVTQDIVTAVEEAVGDLAVAR
jgi:hypothetical protein